MVLLRRARIQIRSTKHVLLAREQFIKHVWHCTRNGFGARKLPAESSPRPNVLCLSSGMPEGAQTPVFVMSGDAVTLKVLVLSIEKSWLCASLKQLYPARAHLSTSETHLYRQASSEFAYEHVGNAFGLTSAQRGRVRALRKRIWMDKRRARAHLSIQVRLKYPDG